ncbi:MAG: FecR domain-containing protein, partial [Myxococcota bacterium]
ELEQALKKARETSAADDNPDAARRALLRFHQMRETRRRRQRVLGAAAAVSIAALIAVFVFTDRAQKVKSDPADGQRLTVESYVQRTEEPIASPQLIHFPDGSSATLLTSHTELRMESVSDASLELTMSAGEARFDVKPNPGRLFRVRSAGLRIEVLGTSFTVRTDRHQTSVSVHEGRVAVHQADRRNILTEGMSLKFDHALAPEAKTPPSVESSSPAPSAPVAPAAPRRQRRRDRPRSTKPAPSRKLSFEARREEIRRLLAAADVDRFRGQPEEAVRKLQQIVRRYASHPQAVPAAFMLGRVLRRELGAPRQAADAFANAYRLDPEGTLADDALANEVECWAAVGQARKARERAKVYVQRFPGGRNGDRVRRAIQP